MSFIDTHNHCTWGIDDGIQSLEECKALFQMAKEDGIDTIIATPHFIPGRQQWNEVSQMANRMVETRDLAHTFGIDYYSGCELFLNEDYLEMIENEWFYPLANSNYVLCEFNVREKLQDSTQVEDRLYELIIRGYTPIVAHVERYFHTKIDLSRVQDWIDMGCKIQVNRTSLLGDHGRTIQKNAYQLFKNAMVHIVASDAHRASGHRICQLSDAYQWIQKNVGQEAADVVLHANPEHILKSEPLENITNSGSTRRFWRGKESI